MERHEHSTYRITWSAGDSEYVGLCTEFPSLSWLATTHTAALDGIEKRVCEVIAICSLKAKHRQRRWQRKLQ
ncbi:hypothetical protein ACQ86O_06190 [Serratia sp. L9]|uniref:hypothetical protein n=1 Tax=Serratia sp. L9 TaxID=3423946 RepID=UPI003D67A608